MAQVTKVNAMNRPFVLPVALPSVRRLVRQPLRRVRRLATFAIAAWTLWLGVAGAEAQSAEAGIFGEVIDVRVINVEVVVEDKDGIRVNGLTANDFLLMVDGEEVPIDYFTEVRGGMAIADEGGAGTVGLPSLSTGQEVGTSYLVFVDDYFSIARDRDLVLDSIREDLPLLGPNDRMAVVAYDGSDLEMLSSWSQSVPALERVLRDASARKALGLQRIAEQREVDLDAFQNAFAELEGDDVLIDRFALERLSPEQRYYATRLAEQVERSVTAAAATLRSFGSPPGRKVMLLLSGGWPFVPTDFVVGTERFTLFDRVAPEGSELFEPLSDTANLLGYTLYPIDVPGPGGADTVDVSRSGPVGSRNAFERGILRQRDREYSLRFIADLTGGKAQLAGNRVRALERVVEDTQSYYWLGFVPQREMDNQRHDIRVTVRGGRFKVRSREGFLDSSRQREVTMAVESTLLFGNSAAEGGLAVELGEAKRAGIRKVTVPLSVLIPVERLTFLPVADGFAAQVEIRLAVMDGAGGRSEIPVIPVTLTSEDAPRAGGYARYDTTLKLRRERHRAVVSVFDPASGRIFTNGVEIAP